MTPHAYLSHRSFRRLRVKVPSKRGDKLYFTQLNEGFRKCKGIETLEVNPITGSILLIHSIDLESISQYAEGNNLFILKTNSPMPLFNGISAKFNKFDDRVKRITGNGLDITGITVLTLFGLGISQISRGNFRAIPWDAAFWYALNIFWQRPAR
ncbi:MAG: hypothetical protein Q7J76_03985 [Candidatus Brocadiaceae bacterium]|uniref:hypothetical protein n=1 Tax=Candidatus Wunengus sp. YC61 TaxID=3367698 RepID=UPI0027211057|nr:hypothetical protein [Candidatus Brocadiaceae bacterium]